MDMLTVKRWMKPDSCMRFKTEGSNAIVKIMMNEGTAKKQLPNKAYSIIARRINLQEVQIHCALRTVVHLF